MDVLMVLAAAALFLLGLIFGSFANVVIARVPDGRSVVRPRSACPGCGTEIAARDNIPLVSWVLLRGRCRTCATGISIRYPLVELSVGVLWLLLGWWAARTDHLGLLPLLLVWGFVGVCLFMIDLDHHRLPDALTLPMLVVTPIGLVVTWLLGDPVDLLGALLGAAIWGGFLLGLWAISAGRGMGLGDVKMAPSLGATIGAIGVGASLAGLLLGFLLGGFVGLILLAFKRAGRRTRIAFGPFLLVGALLGVLVGPQLASAYGGLL